MSQVSVSINGKTYRMACGDGEEDRLLGLAKTFDTYVANLKASFGEIGDQRLTVMAGIMLVDELSEANRQLADSRTENATLREVAAAVEATRHAEGEGLVQRLSEAAEQIERLTAALAPGKAAPADAD